MSIRKRVLMLIALVLAAVAGTAILTATAASAFPNLTVT
jgi:hypothetical protein